MNNARTYVDGWFSLTVAPRSAGGKKLGGSTVLREEQIESKERRPRYEVAEQLLELPDVSFPDRRRKGFDRNVKH